MKKAILYSTLALAFALAVPRAAHAQGGCDDTPENPTFILAGLASGVYGANMLRTRLRARKAAEQQSEQG